MADYKSEYDEYCKYNRLPLRDLKPEYSTEFKQEYLYVKRTPKNKKLLIEIDSNIEKIKKLLLLAQKFINDISSITVQLVNLIDMQQKYVSEFRKCCKIDISKFSPNDLKFHREKLENLHEVLNSLDVRIAKLEIQKNLLSRNLDGIAIKTEMAKTKVRILSAALDGQTEMLTVV